MAPVKKPPRTRQPTFLTQWRKFRQLSQEAAVERLDIDRSTLSRIERGETPYDQDFLEKAALAYGCDPEDLLSIDPLKPDPPKLIFDALKQASREKQEEVWRVVQAMLKAG